MGSIWGPKGLPESIRSKLETAMSKAMKTPDFVDGAKKLQQPWFQLGGKEYARMLQDRFEEYKRAVKDLNLQEN